ncbi:MAG TPA: hydantoinase B/oxoprolinase family protein [Gemmatimonadales bacterium]|nr:hydantoinase B/oxoprolinase family protein [Gemmatimonadales bacterium]
MTRPGALALDAVGLEVMAHAFASIAEEMGLVLIHSALSPNIRERRDCSAALFDADGEMIAQAAHIPVHLGAMAEAVAAVRGLQPAPAPGEIFVVNDPFTGGTHLPDLTLIGAVEVEGAVGAYSVVRAHHSDVGGMQPGSMPAGARELFAEGLILPPVRWTAEVERILLANVRTPALRRGDLAAQRAAVVRGGEGLRALAARHGWSTVRAAARELVEYAERRTRALLGTLPVRNARAVDVLEGDGVEDRDLAIRVRLDVKDGVLHADFAGTAPQTAGNVNCPLAVARSAVLLVVRTLLPDDVPTNGGVGRAVRVTAPEGCLLNPRHPAAVAAGNVETSQRIADTVFLALARAGVRVPAQGQGTMNNVTFGGGGTAHHGPGRIGWTYYETIGGGQGASQGAPGPSGVHVGMSNTRNTPIEVLELECPIRVRRYALRRGSGGGGRWAGGDGVVREFEALAAMEVSVLAERRRHRPRGAAGGGDGAPGRTLLNARPLAAKAVARLRPGDRLRVETPGGGGWGRKAVPRPPTATASARPAGGTRRRAAGASPREA